MRGLCNRALALYPRAWRTRYEDEVRALLEQRPGKLATLANLLVGALDAHLHPGELVAGPLARMRGTVSATLCCWVAFVVAGGGFAKSTEDAAFRSAGHAHGLLGATRTTVTVLAVVMAATVLLAGAPLIFAVLSQAWRERRPALWRALLAPPVAVAIVLVLGRAAASAARGAHPQGAGPIASPAAFVIWTAVGLACAAVCALAARAALQAARLGSRELRVGVIGASLLARAMVALTVAVALYAVALSVDAPALAASWNTPLRVSTAASLWVLAAVMAATSALAVATTRRGWRALASS